MAACMPPNKPATAALIAVAASCHAVAARIGRFPSRPNPVIA
jgi:hypothetical protein